MARRPNDAAYRTITVSASNSSGIVRQKSDFQCDGQSDQETIQAAIDIANNNGAEVYLCEGHYRLDGAILLDSNITLRFEPGAKIMLDTDIAPSGFDLSTATNDPVVAAITNRTHYSTSAYATVTATASAVSLPNNGVRNVLRNTGTSKVFVREGSSTSGLSGSEAELAVLADVITLDSGESISFPTNVSSIAVVRGSDGSDSYPVLYQECDITIVNADIELTGHAQNLGSSHAAGIWLDYVCGATLENCRIYGIGGTQGSYDPVDDRKAGDAMGTPDAGTRYLCTSTAGGNTKDKIYEYDGSDWTATSTSIGDMVFVLDEQAYYTRGTTGFVANPYHHNGIMVTNSCDVSIHGCSADRCGEYGLAIYGATFGTYNVTASAVWGEKNLSGQTFSGAVTNASGTELTGTVSDSTTELLEIGPENFDEDLMARYINGVVLSVTGDDSLSLAADFECGDSTGTEVISSSSAITIDCSAAGINGTKAGLSFAANTTYWVYAIIASDGTVATIVTDETSSPTIPESSPHDTTDKYRKIGWVRTDDDADFLSAGSISEDPETVTFVEGLDATDRVQRSQLAEESLVAYPVPFGTFTRHDSGSTPLGGDDDDLSLGINIDGSNSYVLSTGTITAGTSENTKYAAFMFALPPEYVAGGDVQVEIYSVVRDYGGLDPFEVKCDLDVEVYKLDPTGDDGAGETLGSDLCTTAAVDMLSDTQGTGTPHQFTVTSTGLAPGDVLVARVAITYDHTDGSLSAKASINLVQMLLDIKG